VPTTFSTPFNDGADRREPPTLSPLRLRSATIAAATEVSTLVLSRSAVTRLLEQEPKFATVMATVLSWRTRRLERAVDAPVGLRFDASGGLVD
jgi:CRP-like cAMP-binding protein